jgi:hypothetical protein
MIERLHTFATPLIEGVGFRVWGRGMRVDLLDFLFQGVGIRVEW